MDEFVNLIRDILVDAGISPQSIHHRRGIVLPGYYRAEKKWDLVVVDDGELLAAIELKSHVGSFGNNFNNRTEETLGVATDLWAAYREGAFHPSPRPWLGYLMLLEEAKASSRPIKPAQPHFRVFDEFLGASYAKRYEILITKMLRERLYDGGCLLLSSQETGLTGVYREPNLELNFARFAQGLAARALAHSQSR